MAIVTRFSSVGFLVLLLVASFAPVTDLKANESVAVIEQLQGDVQRERDGAIQSVSTGDQLNVADVILTGPEGAVGLKFTDGSLVALGPGTRFVVESYEFDAQADRGRFDGRIDRGALSIRSGRIAKKGQDRMRVRTPSTILGVRGTRFMVRVEPDNQ